jgi:hypothetical protein
MELTRKDLHWLLPTLARAASLRGACLHSAPSMTQWPALNNDSASFLNIFSSRNDFGNPELLRKAVLGHRRLVFFKKKNPNPLQMLFVISRIQVLARCYGGADRKRGVCQRCRLACRCVPFLASFTYSSTHGQVKSCLRASALLWSFVLSSHASY